MQTHEEEPWQTPPLIPQQGAQLLALLARWRTWGFRAWNYGQTWSAPVEAEWRALMGETAGVVGEKGGHSELPERPPH